MHLPFHLPALTLLLPTLLLPIHASPSLHIRLPSSLPPLPPSTHASLLTPGQPLLTAPITTRNGFLFRNLTAGIYDLDVACREYDFEKGLVVRVGEECGIEVRRGAAVIPGPAKGSQEVDGKLRLEFEMAVTRRREWREERVGFSPLSLLQNPMILIAVVGLGIVIGMPYLLDNMDPEMRAEFEEQQKKSILSGGASTGNPLQNFDMAAWMAGKTSGAASTEAQAVEEPKSGGGKKRRG